MSICPWISASYFSKNNREGGSKAFWRIFRNSSVLVAGGISYSLREELQHLSHLLRAWEGGGCTMDLLCDLDVAIPSFFWFSEFDLFCCSWSCQYEVWRSVDQQGCAIFAKYFQSLNNVCELKKRGNHLLPRFYGQQNRKLWIAFLVRGISFLGLQTTSQKCIDTRTLEQSIYDLISFFDSLNGTVRRLNKLTI